MSSAVALVVLLGITWRATRYALQFPIWGDEAMICLNLLDRDYVGLARPLRFVQAAPLLFLWAERTMLEFFGPAELSLRLLSVVAGIAGLVLFTRLTRSLLSPLAAAIAIAILAVSYYPVRHSCEVKPYGIDLAVATLLLVLAAGWLQHPARLGWLVSLTLLVPFAVGISYPSLFIAGSISLVFLPTVWRGAGWQPRVLFLVYNLAMLAAFLGFYLFVGVGQFESEGGHDNHFYSEWFPPAEPLALLRWLAVVHTGNMFAYPAGGHSGGSILTTIVCLVGIVYLVRERNWTLLVLCLAPFVLTFLAAAMHRYPYGGSARYEQHLAPLICILAGTGLTAIIAQVSPSERYRLRVALTSIALLAILGAVGLGRDLVKPYKTAGDKQVRQLVLGIIRQAGPDDQIVVMDPVAAMGPTVEWYLRSFGGRVRWDGSIDRHALAGRPHQLWTLYFSEDSGRLAGLEAALKEICSAKLVEQKKQQMQLGWSWDQKTVEYCEVYQWRCEPASRVTR